MWAISPKSSISKIEILIKLRKMISINIKLLTALLSGAIILITNPVKIRIILLVLRIVIFFIIALESGIIWFPVLFALLFIGGILIIFIILSSILPNEKRLKIKIFMMSIPVAIYLSRTSGKIIDIRISAKVSKRFLRSRHTFYFLIIILILYFFCTIRMLCKNEIPMRSCICCEKILIL